jgi:phosphatidylglycerol lysyltransferase
MLIFTRKQYIIKSDPKLKNVGILTALLVMLAVFIYGIFGFYLLDKNHFNIDFSFVQSWQYTLQNYFLIRSETLIPHDRFARFFLFSINASGFLSITFLIYTFVRSFIPHKNVSDEEFSDATQLIESYGNSALDYFKTYRDKMIFFSQSRKAFLSYRISGHFAVVLEAPVAADNDEMTRCIEEFDKFCYQNGLNNLYYRVPAKSLNVFTALSKKTMFIGQEAVVDLTAFSMTGNSKKSLRNALNKIKSSGYTTTVHMPPVKDGVVQKLKLVSDEWLEDTGRKEIVFSQGMFDWEEIKNQEIITVENDEEKIVAFLNIIPDHVQEETTYDLMRKTKDAPNGVMDFILIALFDDAKSRGYRYVNLGFAPISVDNETKSFPEKTVKFAYNRIKALQQHKGIRDYKQKFDPEWNDRYLVYDQDYDLFQVPAVLAKVIKS